MAVGKCTLCGDGIQSGTALYCVACFRKYSRPCSTCTEAGRLKHKYQKHEGKGSMIRCTRCDCKHDDTRQLVCKTCANERMLFDPPKKLSEVV
jgi:RecJ-like exonuclease